MELDDGLAQPGFPWKQRASAENGTASTRLCFTPTGRRSVASEMNPCQSVPARIRSEVV